MRESQIIHQVGEYWVSDADKQYTVYEDGLIVARADSSFHRTPDGLSLAIARANYLHKRHGLKQ